MSICVKIVVVNKINNIPVCGKSGVKDMKNWKYCLFILIVLLSSQVISMNVSAITLPLEIGVVRNNNTWLLDAYSNGVYGTGDLTYSYGKAGDVFVTGDWNRDGWTEIGVVRNNNTWMLDMSANGIYGPGDLTYMFGKAGDIPIVGKWN
jgi:hypothetical protein